jgi:hypothetical protein
VSILGIAFRRVLNSGTVRRPHTSLLCRLGYQELGWLGKQNQKKILGKFRRSRRGAVGLACQLMLTFIILGCGHQDLAEPLQSGKVFGWSGLQGRWVGPVAPSDPACGHATLGLLSIGESDFGFDPFQSTTVIAGKVTNDGRLEGNLVRESPDHKPLSISFQAAQTGADAIKGELQSGRCHWVVTLHRG